MRKIITNLKAGTIPIMAILIVVILIIAGAVIFINPEITGSKSYWETEAKFGTWQDEILIEFDDGSTQAFKIIDENKNKPLTVAYDGKAVKTISLKLRASVSGSGYDGAEININNVGYTVSLHSAIPGGFTKTWGDTYKNTHTYKVPIGNTQQLQYRTISASELEGSGAPNGAYLLTFKPQGTVTYKGYPDGGDLENIDLPASRTVPIAIAKTSTGSITVTLSSDVTST